MLKIIITAIIVLLILLSYLSTNPTVSGFLTSIKDRASSLISPHTKSGDTNFVLVMEKTPEIGFSSERIKITVEGDTSGSMGSNSINTGRMLTITNFTGQWNISRNAFYADGRYDSAALPDVFFGGGTLSLRSSYNRVELERVSLGSLDLAGSGSLEVAGTETSFDGKIGLKSVVAVLYFGDNLRIEGTASEISIPGSGIIIA